MREEADIRSMHLFVCQHARGDGRDSCGARWDAGEALSILKAGLREAGLGRVRVSKAGCLGPCEKGPNLLLYPQRVWFHEVGTSDLPAVVQRVRRIAQDEEPEAGSVAAP